MNANTALSLAAIALIAFTVGTIGRPVLRSVTATGISDSKGSGTTAGTQGLSISAERSSSSIQEGRRPGSAKELVAGIRDALKDQDDSSRQGHLWWLCQGLTPENAEEVVEAATKGTSGEEREQVLSVLFNSWGQVDAKSALAYAKKLEGKPHDRAILGALVGWASGNFPGASAWVDQLPDGSLKRDARRGIIGTLAESDPAAALDLIDGKVDARGVYSYVSMIFPALTRRDPETAAERAASLPLGTFRTQALRVVATQWAQTDRPAALAWIETLPEGVSKQQTLSGVLQDWVQTDFDGSLAWLQKQPEGATRNRMVVNLTYMTASEEPENALKFVDLVSSKYLQNDMLETIGRRLSADDSEAALKWAQSQADAGVKKAAWEGVLEGMSPEDPQRAAALALQLPDDQKDSALNNVAETWARHDPTSAATWAFALKDAPARGRVLGNVMGRWMDDDPTNALKWFSAIPDGEDRDMVVDLIGNSVIDNDPNFAVRLAQSIQNPKSRTTTLERLAASWKRTDATAASAWIENSDLSPEAKKRLLGR